MQTIELKDIGRPQRLSIPIPDEGGVVLLTGPNGSGKSTALEAVQDAITGRKQTRSTVRDGADQGRLTGCGVTMTVGRRVTRSGELTVETLDGGRLSIADVVSPPFKGAEEADGRRIKALVQLAGVEADPMLFAGLLSNFRDVVDVDELNRDDILEMAAQIKRQIEESARKCEGLRDENRQQALACKEAIQGISLDVETDAGVLQLALEEAVRRGQELISAAQEAKRRNSEILDARQKITAATLVRPGESLISIDEARQREIYCHNSVNDAQSKVEKLEKELQAARWDLERTEDRWSDAKRELETAERFQTTLAGLESIVNKGELTGPTDDELSAADEAITEARKAIEAGAAARVAKEKLHKAESFRLVERVNEDFATKYRAAAAGVDQVITNQIARLKCPLRVEAGRLVTATDRGPSTFFAELSDGERWRIATQIAINAVGPKGLLTIPQAAWGEIQPKVRLELDALARKSQVTILSAVATDDEEIQAETFEELEAAGV